MSRRVRAALLLTAMLALAAPARAGDETCRPEPASQWAPAGVSGCTLDGPTAGVASTWGGDVAAANWCTWALRHSGASCGLFAVQSHQTGVTMIVEPAEYCMCWWMTDRRLIDLTTAQVHALGLDPSDGLFRVTVTPLAQPGRGGSWEASTSAPVSLPDTSTEAP